MRPYIICLILTIVTAIWLFADQYTLEAQNKLIEVIRNDSRITYIDSLIKVLDDIWTRNALGKSICVPLKYYI